MLSLRDVPRMGRTSHFGFGNLHGNWGDSAWQLSASDTEGVCMAHAHTHAAVHKFTKSALWRILQVWPGKETHNIQNYQLWLPCHGQNAGEAFH